MFAACNLTGAVIVYFFLYESSDLSLESVDLMYNDPRCSPWNSRRWVPEGFTSRDDLVAQDRVDEARKSPVGVEDARNEKVASEDGHVPSGKGAAKGVSNGGANGDGTARV